MHKVSGFLKPYRLHMGAALLLMLVELGVELVQPLLIAKIINEGILAKNMDVVFTWGWVMVGISLFAFASGISNSFLASFSSQGFAYDIRKSLFGKIQKYSFANLDHYQASSLITRLTNDVTQIQTMVFMSLRIMLRAPLLVVFGTVMALVIDAKLAAVLLVTIPLLLLFLLWVLRMAGAMFRKVQENLDQVNGIMRENLSGIRLIKAFLNSGHEISRFTESSGKLKDRTIKVLQLIETSMPILLFVMNAGIIVILWLGSHEVASGSMLVGDVVAIVNYALRMTMALTMFSFIIMSFSRTKASSARLREVLNEEVDLFDAADVRQDEKIAAGSVVFDRVSFKYPGADEFVLKDISFEAKAGKMIAVMGATGSGKTSLFQLIPRLYDPAGGSIHVDGKDIRQFRLEDLRNQIGYAPQEAMLFSGSISENISWGKEDASFEEIREAAESAQIHETIMKLPEQYDSPLGQRGVNLSGGQKQRLSVARALVRKPKILLLDDSTSALDLKTEGRLLDAVRKYQSTIFIITQKISTAMEADDILLMQDGQLLAQGSHEELLKDSPLYRKISDSQAGRRETV
ncbi:ABC transporter ATP-binding protein/permease [Metabacillus sp. GX 13764]|uniref:ABC transporter ATP-binding protein n=1 Tax=Metabacillus kandeliae TaxID=2900151 RepID=UPI001E4D1A44|nr:ABC transporter ATP-binding protein [Metabacillus kandeliae]MCD7034001.1 ABC transporter ATP-binding protein/permease [Metabacillus kandeliae]